MLCRNLWRVESIQEGDWSSVQTDIEELGDERGANYNRRLYGTFSQLHTFLLLSYLCFSVYHCRNFMQTYATGNMQEEGVINPPNAVYVNALLRKNLDFNFLC